WLRHLSPPEARVVGDRCGDASGALEQRGGAHPAGDAHAHDGVASLAAAPAVERGEHEARTRDTERVPERDRAAVHVELLRIDLELARAVERLRLEGIVELH